MKTYEGQRFPRAGILRVLVHEGGRQRELLPGRSRGIRDHSPDGFEWGYGGSGPAQLALAILADVAQDDRLAEEWHQAFKWAFVSRFDRWSWTVKEDDIWNWLGNQVTLRRAYETRREKVEVPA